MDDNFKEFLDGFFENKKSALVLDKSKVAGFQKFASDTKNLFHGFSKSFRAFYEGAEGIIEIKFDKLVFDKKQVGGFLRILEESANCELYITYGKDVGLELVYDLT